MELVGVRFNDREQAVQTVFEYTYGHPNLIQFLCNEILSKLSRTKSRSISTDLILETCSNTTYRDKFVETFWSQANPVEKAISGCISELGQASQSQIIEHLRKAGFEPTIYELQNGLRYLELSQLIEVINEEYQIRPAKFNDYLQILGYEQWYKQWRNDYERQLLSS